MFVVAQQETSTHRYRIHLWLLTAWLFSKKRLCCLQCYWSNSWTYFLVNHFTASTDLSSVNVWICRNVFISYNNCQCLSIFYTFFLRWTLNRLIFLWSLGSLEQRKERYVTLEGRKLGRSLDIASSLLWSSITAGCVTVSCMEPSTGHWCM